MRKCIVLDALANIVTGGYYTLHGTVAFDLSGFRICNHDGEDTE